MSDSALEWNALWTLAQTMMLDVKESKQLKNALEDAKISFQLDGKA